MAGTKKTIAESAQTAVARKILDYAQGGDPAVQLPKMLKAVDTLLPNDYLVEQRALFHQVIDNPDNNWMVLLKSLWTDVDDGVRTKAVENLLVNASLIGLKRQDNAAAEYGCNVPWAMLVDPTSACNLHCTGCWAAEYGDKLNLSFDELDGIIEQGKELGVFFYLFSGGEPLVRKRDIVRLCEKHGDCAFTAFTNATLIDDAFAEDLLRVKNFIPAISVEGFEEATDARRGDGTYRAVLRAMDVLKAHRLPFGVSCCYTHDNARSVGSEEFVDDLVARGAKFAWFFTYMPVGCSAPTDLLATAEDRAFMYRQVRKFRETKPLFTMDFWNDGEFTQGCIAGGRRYLHINANGDIEPCAFIHYSDSNIRDTTVLEALRRPLFMAYHDSQPFNDNHLRPCPVLDNKDKLAEMVASSGARSTDLEQPEDAAALCAKTHATADKWAPVAQEIWEDGHWTTGPNKGRRK
ncbi:radical SAM protein [Gordonibacter sp. 28C]|uniref:radical SAM protein n=1 Tax=Gordonibacter sp. 28C TaxID=2078569 RepID=UPI000DF7CEA6|nr:radical SAM protein [Gordonibacter sp. 28C]RDB61689.1 radical SAM protein [Gordonibacter sp. 28C]